MIINYYAQNRKSFAGKMYAACAFHAFAKPPYSGAACLYYDFTMQSFMCSPCTNMWSAAAAYWMAGKIP